MKSFLFTFLLLCFIVSCKEKTVSSKTTLCGVKDPVRNLPWLRDLIEEAKKKGEARTLSVVVVKIGSENVINYYMSYMSCIGCVSYHCDGTRMDLAKYTEQEVRDYQNRIFGDHPDRIVLWPEK